jgi:BASS family bile acid:Na+ symporter
MLGLLKNRDFILILGLGLGLLADGWAIWTHHLAIPALAVVMTLSTMGVSGQQFRPPSRLLIAGLWGIGLSYVLLTGLLLVISRFFTYDEALWYGFVLVAAAPPAVAVIPFTDFLDGDRAFSLLATMGAYLAALFIMPFIAALHWEADFISPAKIFKVLLLLVVLPVAIGQGLRKWGWDQKLASIKGSITNWCFFVVVYSIVGLNSKYILTNPLGLLPLFLCTAAIIFGLGIVIELAGKWLGVPRDRLHSMVLLGTLKNYGLAGGLALALFDHRTALPAVVSTTFMIIYIIWLSILKRHFHKA